MLEGNVQQLLHRI